MRKDILLQTHSAGSGHPGGSLSATEFLVTLYFEFLKHDSDNPHWEERDLFILSKCHVSPAYYSILCRTGYFDPELLPTFRSLGSPLQGHPTRNMKYGIEVTGGSLGQNLSVAVGRSLAMKHAKKSNTVYAMSSEGELQEGQMWEAIMSAAHFKLDNLILLVDYNELQIDGHVEDVMGIKPLDEKFKAFNWHTIVIDGHNHKEIYDALTEAKTVTGKPTVIIGKTHKGQGVSFMKDQAGWHGKPPGKDDYEKGMAELEALEQELGLTSN